MVRTSTNHSLPSTTTSEFKSEGTRMAKLALHEERFYETSPLPTFADQPTALSPEQVEIAKLLYGEICTSWRALMDVRFKLMGFVPTVSVVVLITLLSRDTGNSVLTPTRLTGLLLFGLLVTMAIWVFDQRNSEHYDELVARGRKLEEELGIATGQFLGRPQPLRRIGPLVIGHRTANYLFYFAAFLGWIFALVAVWTGL